MTRYAIEPTDDRLVILPKDVKGEETTEGGIILTEGAREKPAEGTVVAAGPGRRGHDGVGRVKPALEVGDVVLYAKYSGVEVTVDKQDLLIVREADILARLPR